MFQLIQAAHDEVAELRADFATILAKFKAGERSALHRMETIEKRIERVFGHTTSALAAAHPANTPEAGMVAAPTSAPDSAQQASNTAKQDAPKQDAPKEASA